jgi:hypothetical protein
MRRSTRLTAGALVLGSALAASGATAGPPAAPATASPSAPATSVFARTGAMPSFQSLPQGHVPPPPETKAPGHLAASERVDGFNPTGLPPEQLEQMRASRQDSRVTYLFSDEAQVKDFKASKGGRDDKIDACLTDGGDVTSVMPNGNEPDGDAEPEPREWPSNFQSMLAFQFELNPKAQPPRRLKHFRARSGADMHVIHSERFVAGQDGSASLAMTDAWFDVRTRGARLVSRSTLPLARVFVGPNGLEVYAARDGDALEVVFHVPDKISEDDALTDQLRPRVRNMNIALPDRSGANSDCGHVRFTLRPSVGAGQMATLQATAFLPPLDGVLEPAPEGETSDARGSRLLQAMRQRPFQLSVSATSTSVDPKPVVSIALGWIGRERSAT